MWQPFDAPHAQGRAIPCSRGGVKGMGQADILQIVDRCGSRAARVKTFNRGLYHESLLWGSDSESCMTTICTPLCVPHSRGWSPWGRLVNSH